VQTPYSAVNVDIVSTRHVLSHGYDKVKLARCVAGSVT